jgi:hypothetical protein
MGGLKEEIRAPIALYQPKNVDTTSALALLQEEEVESRRKHTSHKHENKDLSKSGSKGFTASDKAKTPVKKTYKAPMNDKMVALFAHMKANGLCFTCGEKWTRKNHKCPEQVPIHILQ